MTRPEVGIKTQFLPDAVDVHGWAVDGNHEEKGVNRVRTPTLVDGFCVGHPEDRHALGPMGSARGHAPDEHSPRGCSDGLLVRGGSPGKKRGAHAREHRIPKRRPAPVSGGLRSQPQCGATIEQAADHTTSTHEYGGSRLDSLVVPAPCGPAAPRIIDHGHLRGADLDASGREPRPPSGHRVPLERMTDELVDQDSTHPLPEDDIGRPGIQGSRFHSNSGPVFCLADRLSNLFTAR